MLRSKSRFILNRVLCVFLVAVMMSSTLFVNEASAATATSTRSVSMFKVEGSVTMTKGTDKEFKGKEGLNLYDGYTVSTGSDSYCWLKLDDDSLLKMDQKSKIKISKASSKKLSISVLSGGLSVDAETQEKGSEVEVRVGNSALAIRGTYFTVEAGAGASVVYTMFEGSGVVDGIDLPKEHVMNVYSRNSKNTANNKNAGSKSPSAATKEELVHELAKFKIDKNTSAFVLQTVLDDVDRFIDNGIIKEENVSEIEKLLADRLLEIKKRADAPAYRTNMSYYMPGGSQGGSYVGSDVEAIDKTYLTDSINLAKNVAKTTFIDTLAANVFMGFNWVTQAEMNTLSAAVTDAENLYSSVTTTAQIDTAVTQLFMTLLRFEASKKLGTKPPTPEIRILQTAIVKSSNAKENVTVSVDGSDVYVDSYWVDVNDMNAMNTAVANAYDATRAAIMATSAAIVPSFTSMRSSPVSFLFFTAAPVAAVNTFAASPIETAAQELARAVIGFNSVKKPGTKSLDMDKLRNAIDHAVSVAGDINISTDGYDVDANEYWITKEFHDAFLAGIAYAEEQYNTVTTQHEITLAIYSVNQWIYTVIDVMQWGKQEPAIPLIDADKYELNRAITDARDALNGVIKSEGYDVASRKLWVLPWLYDHLSSAVMAAEAALSTVKSIGQVYEEANKLDKVLTFFIECTMEGPLTELPLPEAQIRPLLNAVNNAKTAMDGIIVSDRGDDLLEGTKWILTSTFDLLRKEWTYATAALKSGQNIKIRTDALNSAIKVFGDCIATVRYNKTGLNSYIEHAYFLMEGIKISQAGDGTDMGDTDAWVTQNDYNEINAAIAAATSSMDVARSQAEIDAASLTLGYAVLKFQSAIQSGRVWVNQRTGSKHASAYDAVSAAIAGDTIELTGNGLIPFALNFNQGNGVTINPLGNINFDNMNLVINEGATLTLDAGELSVSGNGKITNNGTIINGGFIAIGAKSFNDANSIHGESSFGEFVNNSVIVNKQYIITTELSEFTNNGEFTNDIRATATIGATFNNHGIVNNYSSTYMIGYTLLGGLTISGWFVNADTGRLDNYPDATAVINGVSENAGIINNFSMGEFIYEDIDGMPLSGDEFVYCNGITIEGIFVNNGTIKNVPNGEFMPNTINVPMKITEYFTNNGTINNLNQLTIDGNFINEKSSKLNNGGNINITSGQCIFTENASLINDGTMEVFGAKLKFELNGILSNHGVLLIKNDSIFGMFNALLLYESVEPFTNVGDIFVYDMFNYLSSAAFTNEGSINVEEGSFMVSGMADLINNKTISAFFGGTFSFSSSGKLLNNGMINIYAEFFEEPEGTLIYTSDSDIVNAKEIIMNGSITVNSGVKLTGKAGAKVVIGESVSGSFRSDFYDSVGTGVIGRIPTGEYAWNGTTQRWVRQTPFEPGEQGLYKGALVMAIENAEFIKGWTVVSEDGVGLSIGTPWVTNSDMVLLNNALDNAKIKLNAVTQKEIDEAEAGLNTRIELFSGVIRIKSLDKSALEAAAADGNAAKAGILVSWTGDGTDVPAGESWVPIALLTSLEAYLNFLDVHLLDNIETQEDVDDWAIIINEVIANFVAGIQVAPPLNTSALELAIEAAKAAKAGVMTSEIGGIDIPYGEPWVTLEWMETFEQFVNSAENIILQNVNTQNVIDTWTNDVNGATALFMDSIVITLLDKSGLEEAIYNAEEILAGLDPQDLSSMLLNIAISEAKAVLANAETQDEIDIALADLNDMIEDCKPLDTSGLEDAIARAEAVLLELDQQELLSFLLNIAIGEAKTALVDAGTQQEIDDALIELNIMINSILFDVNDLMTAIARAEAVLLELDPLDFSSMLLNIAISEAKAVLANAETQDEIDDALLELNIMINSILLNVNALLTAIDEAEDYLKFYELLDPSSLTTMFLSNIISEAKNALANASVQDDINDALDEINAMLSLLFD